MDSRAKWELIHEYQRAVRNVLVTPLVCSKDQTILSVGIDRRGEPMLFCYTCDKRIHPGLDLWGEIKGLMEQL